MTTLELDPLGLVFAVAVALLLVGLAAYQLGWHEGVRAERERQQEQTGWRGGED